jgi:hypothetical protein
MNSENPVQSPAIILVTDSTNPEFNGDCDYAVVCLTPEVVDQVRRRVELARQAGKQDDSLCELYFWDGTAEFYDSDLVDACQAAFADEKAAQEWLDGLEQEGHALLPADTDLAALQSQRTECDQMVVRCSPLSRDPHYEIAWTASPKHTDVYVTTRDLPLAKLEGYVHGEAKAD